jgi:hypothetical protein
MIVKGSGCQRSSSSDPSRAELIMVLVVVHQKLVRTDVVATVVDAAHCVMVAVIVGTATVRVIIFVAVFLWSVAVQC